MKEVFNYEINGESFEAHVKHNVPLADLLGAVKTAVDLCYLEDGSYHPELTDFAVRYAILDTLTDIEVPATSNEVYRLTNAVDFDEIWNKDMEFIDIGVAKQLNYQTRLIVATANSDGANRIADMLENICLKIGDIADKTSSLLDNIAKSVEGGEIGDIQKLVSSIEKLNVTPEQMVAGMLDYQKSAKKKTASKSGTTKKTVKKEN